MCSERPHLRARAGLCSFRAAAVAVSEAPCVRASRRGSEGQAAGLAGGPRGPGRPAPVLAVACPPQELKHLILEAADGFLFVVAAETGRVIYVSDSVTPVLNQPQSEWFGSTLYEQVHPDDVEKLREQLCTSENSMTGQCAPPPRGARRPPGKPFPGSRPGSWTSEAAASRCGRVFDSACAVASFLLSLLKNLLVARRCFTCSWRRCHKEVLWLR